jgi:choloylglycine hydrolase
MRKVNLLSAALISLLLLGNIPVNACTGIRLISKDGGVVYGRTMEWGSFDLHSRVAIIPQGYTFTGLTPDGLNGKQYTAKYGAVGLDMIGKDYLGDGMNEKGLAIGLFYHPDFAEYQEYVKSDASNTITALDVTNFILTQFSTVEEVRKGMEEIRVVGVVEKAIGIIIQGHWMVTDASGASIVLEYTKSELKIHDAPLGIITNSPNYDWHITNLSNYINLSQYSFPAKQISGVEIKQIGDEIIHINFDDKKEQDIKDITPKS